MKNTKRVLLSLTIVLILSTIVISHCQVPCGIYGDQMRIDMISEHIETIDKSIKSINEISSEEDGNQNQLVRWINNKDNHSDQLSEIITYYFMAQRVKPVEQDSEGYNEYVAQLVSLHKMQVLSMKAKQNTDTEITKQLKEELENFRKLYFDDKHDHKH
ncbi:MAG: superoxide dismutase [Ni] [Sedimentisphaeraceae bacterium JB056]